MRKVYEIVNQRILELLEKGTIPWRKKWNVATNAPMNLVSKREYRGINVWLLASSPFCSPYWLTFKQVQDKGGHVIKGSKSYPVVFWKFVDRKDSNDADIEDASNKGRMPILRYYNVFNLDQVEGVEPPPSAEIANNFTPIEVAEQIVANMPYGPQLKHGGNQPAYSPMLDYVKMPVPESFETPEEYYSTLFHELTHSTGHSSRVGRKGILEPSFFGSHEYCQRQSKTDPLFRKSEIEN